MTTPSASIATFPFKPFCAATQADFPAQAQERIAADQRHRNCSHAIQGLEACAAIAMVIQHHLIIQIIKKGMNVSHSIIPSHWKIKRSTHFFTKEKIPPALLTHHNTAAGVYGQICVMQGTVTFYGFANEAATEPEKKTVIHAAQFAVSPPEYWHRVELSDDAQFNINFWTDPETDSKATMNSSRIHNQAIETLFDKPDNNT